MEKYIDELLDQELECYPRHNLLELKKIIEDLENVISKEIDNLREELKKTKKKNEFLEKQEKDYQKNFKRDREIFKNQQKEIRNLKDRSKE